MLALIALSLVGTFPALLPPAQRPRGPVNWPQYRFDDAHTGVNPFEKTLSKKNVKFLQLAWQDQLGDLVDFSSPAVVDGVAYIGSTDGRLWAYAADGCGQSLCTNPLWSSTSLAQIIDSPTVANGMVYIGSQTSPSSAAGKLDVFSASGCGQSVCAPLWQGIAGTQSILMSSPTVAGKHVYVGAFDGKLYVFKARGCGRATCKPVWTGATGGSIESTPTVAGGVVYVGSDDGNLYAFNANGCGSSSCAPLWSGTLNNPPFESSPAVVGNVVYIGSQHGVAAFNAAGCGQSVCAPLWQANTGSEFSNGSPAIYKGRVYIGLENGVAVYDANGCGHPTCNPLWQLFGSGAQAAVISSPTVAHGLVFAGRNTAQVLAWSADPCGMSFCSEIWSGLTDDEIVSSSPTVVNGRVYIGSANKFSQPTGRLYVFALPGSRLSR
jgi:outer membrane protein assembly factor BamB